MKRLLSSLWPVAAGVISLSITAGLWLHERRSEQAHLKSSFDFGLRQTASRIEQRMASYEQMLHGVQGLFMADEAIQRNSFITYVNALQAGSGIAGLQAIAYAPYLTSERIDAPLPPPRDQAPRSNKPPSSALNAYAPITYIAPPTGVNLKALGFDPYTDPVRRAAMEQAVDSGNAAITRKLRMVTELDQAWQSGFVMFMPLYDQPQAPLNAANRRNHLTGWVWAGFRMGDLMASLYGENAPGLALTIHDGVELKPDTVMYESNPEGEISVSAAPASSAHALEATEYLGFAGHTWTLRARALPEFEQRYRHDSSKVIAIAGVGVSLLIALLTRQLLTARTRAYDFARSTTGELRASEARYRRIVDAANEGIWRIDSQRRISFANPKMLQMLGYRNDEMMGRPLSEFLADPPEATAFIADPLPVNASTHASTHASADAPLATAARELKLRHKNGSDLWASLSVTQVKDAQGGDASALAMVTDITDAKQAEMRRSTLETQLRASQKMEAIGRLAGGIAHDFNNILAAILGNVALARDRLESKHPALPSLEQIDQAGVRARGLVQQILAFSRMQPHVLISQPLRPLVEESIRLLRAALPAQVEIDTVLAGEPMHVGADATQIQQIVMNLCTNAWHALQGSAGRMTVSLHTAELDANAVQRLNGLSPGRYAHLQVNDTGSGMDASTRDRIFEPFFTTKRVGQGTGLGLSVVHGIMTTHHGAITVDSMPGHGSTFHLYFPLLAPPVETPVQAMRPLPPRGQGQHVMYVDDDPAMLVLVERLLKRAGYRVSTYDSPRFAMSALRMKPGDFDLVVSDFNMPEMTGMDLAQEILMLQPELPIVISSGYISDEMRHTAARIGVQHLLQKEYSLEQLPTVVDAALSGVLNDAHV